MSTDREFADWLRSVPRTKPAEQVEREVMFRDITQGEYFNHEGFPHHYGESRH
jgi:hypothetical protein